MGLTVFSMKKKKIMDSLYFELDPYFIPKYIILLLLKFLVEVEQLLEEVRHDVQLGVLLLCLRPRGVLRDNEPSASVIRAVRLIAAVLEWERC